MNFQDRVVEWMLQCFGLYLTFSKKERTKRFYEEATELVQASHMTRQQAHAMVDYVFDRPVGEFHQEVGGVMLTLAGLCESHDYCMHECGEAELQRVWGNINKIRDKNVEKLR